MILQFYTGGANVFRKLSCARHYVKIGVCGPMSFENPLLTATSSGDIITSGWKQVLLERINNLAKIRFLEKRAFRISTRGDHKKILDQA